MKYPTVQVSGITFIAIEKGLMSLCSEGVTITETILSHQKKKHAANKMNDLNDLKQVVI